MKKLKSHFKFNKQERNGIFYLLVIIVILQVTFFLVNRVSFTETSSFIENKYLQSKLDSLKNAKNEKAQQVFFPFNPNYITDYKGYTLGMSNKEIDRLLKYRSSGKYVNSTEQFQLVTGVSDSLLNIISPYFKYPDWVGKEKEKETKKVGELSQSNRIKKVILDINAATAEDFKTINGIGEKLSARIVKFRDRLGGFLTSEQLYDVYGLDVEVANRAIEVFQVVEPPQVKKININTAEPDELARLLYINFNLASNIVAYRQQVGAIKSFEELNNIEDFPKDKIDRIALYLSL